MGKNLVKVKSGVPQDSVLGPLIFLILISDIDMHLRYCRASSFADDTRIVALENSKSQAVIQEELAEVYRWAAVNLMSFNISKFEHLQYRVHHQLAPLQHCGWKTNKKKWKSQGPWHCHG